MPDIIKDMPELVKKTMLAGVGLALKTWDEVEDMTRELVERGKMGEKEGNKFLDDLRQRYDDTQKKLEARVEKTVKEFLKKANVVTSDELKAVKKEIRELKKMISKEAEKPQD
jgi:polyhydroxyalkanoate synthesis regulator phasin